MTPRIGPHRAVDARSWRDAILVRWRALRERMQGSAWTSLVLRGFLCVIAIVAFAWIGRAAAHAPIAMVPTVPTPAPDAGVALPPPPPTPPAAAIASTPAPAAGHTRATTGDPVFLNHAGAEDLRRLPGVGAKRADAILALRQRIGRFQRVEELLRVKGIGRSTLRKWRPLLRLDVPDAGAP